MLRKRGIEGNKRDFSRPQKSSIRDRSGEKKKLAKGGPQWARWRTEEGERTKNNEIKRGEGEGAS